MNRQKSDFEQNPLEWEKKVKAKIFSFGDNWTSKIDPPQTLLARLAVTLIEQNTERKKKVLMNRSSDYGEEPTSANELHLFGASDAVVIYWVISAAINAISREFLSTLDDVCIDTYQLFVLLPRNGVGNFLRCIVIASAAERIVMLKFLGFFIAAILSWCGVCCQGEREWSDSKRKEIFLQQSFFLWVCNLILKIIRSSIRNNEREIQISMASAVASNGYEM